MNNNQITKLDVDLTIESNLGFPEYITENIKLKLNEDLTNIKILDFDEKNFLINLINKSSQVDISKYSIDYDEIDNVIEKGEMTYEYIDHEIIQKYITNVSDDKDHDLLINMKKTIIDYYFNNVNGFDEMTNEDISDYITNNFNIRELDRDTLNSLRNLYETFKTNTFAHEISCNYKNNELSSHIEEAFNKHNEVSSNLSLNNYEFSDGFLQTKQIEYLSFLIKTVESSSRYLKNMMSGIQNAFMKAANDKNAGNLTDEDFIEIIKKSIDNQKNNKNKDRYKTNEDLSLISNYHYDLFISLYTYLFSNNKIDTSIDSDIFRSFHDYGGNILLKTNIYNDKSEKHYSFYHIIANNESFAKIDNNDLDKIEKRNNLYVELIKRVLKKEQKEYMKFLSSLILPINNLPQIKDLHRKIIYSLFEKKFNRLKDISDESEKFETVIKELNFGEESIYMATEEVFKQATNIIETNNRKKKNNNFTRNF